jgi:hypothetical protein
MKQYAQGNLMKFINAVQTIMQRDPTASTEFIYTQMCQWYPELKTRERCPNCDGSMQMYTFKFDVLDALLLVSMAKVVGERMEQGWEFTEANKIHVQKMEHATYAVRSRTSQCRQLGLVAKVLNEAGKQIGGTWAITRRGWSALRGEAIPSEVVSFQNKIVTRGEETTTISETFRNHRDEMMGSRLRGQHHKNDYSHTIDQFSEINWVHYAELAEGKIL